jgi:hypothetical protein
MGIYMKKITLTLMLLALVGSSSDLSAAQSANKTKSSMMSRMYSAASGAAARIQSMRNNS